MASDLHLGPLHLGRVAHAFGQRYELPIPLWLFVTGGAAVVLASFLLVLGRAGASAPDLDGQDAVPAGRFHPVLSSLALVLTGLVAFCGLSGLQETAENIAPLFFWVIVWIAVPLSCGVLGDWTRSVNPFGAASRLTDRERLRSRLLARRAPLPWPAWLGWWPAVALFVLLVLGELVFNLRTTTPSFVGGILVGYVAACLALGLLFGPAWTTRGEVFTVLFNAWGRLGWFRFGAPGRNGFAGGLEVPFERSLSRVVFVLLMLISINFDGLLSTPQWADFERRSLGADVSGIHWLRTGSLVGLMIVILVVFTAFALGSARAGRQSDRPVGALAGLLPSLVPIAFGYLIAHYLQYLVTNLQYLVPLLRHPRGPVPDSFEIDRTLLPNSFYWYVAVVVIVAAHVAAVVIAHRYLRGRAVDERAGFRSELPWLVAMVAYTAFSLFLIAQPLTQETGSATQVESLSHR
jgi:hypothetical protein